MTQHETSRRIFVVCGDPGGAQAVAPVVRELRREASLSVHLTAYHQAVEVFEQQRLPCDKLPFDLTVDDAAAMLQAADVDLVLSGTSANSADLEKDFLAAARAVGIPSLAVLDFWSNYARRFSRTEDDLACLPDRIAVMDRLARDEMVAAGFPEDVLVITGQPAFEALSVARADFTREDRERARRGLGIGRDDYMVVFVSQPFSALFGRDAGTPGYPGYDERTVFAALLEALETRSTQSGRKMGVVIQPHLRETFPWWEKTRSESVPVRVTGAVNFPRLALSADLVAGMTSTKLVEASLLGCRTLSLQIGAAEGRRFDMRRLGVQNVVFTEEALRREIDAHIANPTGRGAGTAEEMNGGAAARVAALVYEMLEMEKAGAR